MDQASLAEATLRSMGKGFAIRDGTDLGACLLEGYQKHRTPDLPGIKIVAITNDSVATLISFLYSYHETAGQKGTIGLICGTGCNATVPMKLSALHAAKRPRRIRLLAGEEVNGVSNVKIAVNTEWSINGSAPPMRNLGLISHWDEQLDKIGGLKGFQPLEYMTAGRYLGELGRIILVDYLETVSKAKYGDLPENLLERYYLDTTWLSNYKPPAGSSGTPLLELLEEKFPSTANFQWTEEMAEAVHRIAQAIELRAAGIIAAAVIGLLRAAEELPQPGIADAEMTAAKVLGVGYTGGCIVNFQTYLRDTQMFLDEILALDYGDNSGLKVVLTPCHDGGIIGAGILCAAASL
jgi:hexokinase